MHVLVLPGWGGDVDALARMLAEVLGKNLPEARTRLLGGGPIVVASFRELAPAAAMADTLRSRGIADPLVIGDGELETDAGRCFARDFDLGDRQLRVAEHQPGLDVPYGEIELLLRGTRVEAETGREKPSTREFSLARTVMSGRDLRRPARPARRAGPSPGAWPVPRPPPRRRPLGARPDASRPPLVVGSSSINVAPAALC